MGASSSSPLEVKSITADIGRFPLVEPEVRGTTDEDDKINDCPLTGVPTARGVPILTLSPDFVISTRSSSSSLATPLVFDVGEGLL
jgi:hypothetical protein